MRIKIWLPLLLLLLLISAFLFVWLRGSDTAVPSQTSTEFPLVGNLDPEVGSSSTLLVAGTEDTVLVTDFRVNGSSAEDPANAGNYYLAGNISYCDTAICQAVSQDRFSILYFSVDQGFAISLDTEPLGEVRREAEQYLMQKLGITESQMCGLRYTLGTTVYVNATYGQIDNLGFSFCPGATVLPG